MAKRGEQEDEGREDAIARARREGIAEANQAWLMKVVWYIIGVIGAGIYFVIDFLRRGS